MIKGVHTMFYSSEVEELREFIRDKLGLPARDVGGGWLIFDFPEADMGCHPVATEDGKASGKHDASQLRQQIVHVDGLCYVTVHSCGFRSLSIFSHSVSCHRQDW